MLQYQFDIDLVATAFGQWQLDLADALIDANQRVRSMARALPASAGVRTILTRYCFPPLSHG